MPAEVQARMEKDAKIVYVDVRTQPEFDHARVPGQITPPLTPPLTPNTVETTSTIGALFPRGGPAQDPVLTSLPSHHTLCCVMDVDRSIAVD